MCGRVDHHALAGAGRADQHSAALGACNRAQRSELLIGERAADPIADLLARDGAGALADVAARLARELRLAPLDRLL
jgi:hypothetical protein